MEDALKELLAFKGRRRGMEGGYGPIVQDLYSRGLVRIEGTDLDKPIPYDTIDDELRIKKATPLGGMFLRYIHRGRKAKGSPRPI